MTSRVKEFLMGSFGDVPIGCTATQLVHQMHFQVNETYIAEYMQLRELGATHEEAVAQVAQSNEIDAQLVIAD